jgi:trigger factor
MSQIVQAEQIKLDRERVLTRLNDLVASYPEQQQDEARRSYQQNQDAMRQIESAAIEDQVIDWVLGRANITEKPMTFKEITGFGQEQAA